MGKIIDISRRRRSDSINSDTGLVDELECLFEFDSDDAEFTRGWEAGMLFIRLADQELPWGNVFHATNRKMIGRIAKFHSVSPEIEETKDPTWIYVTFRDETGPHLVPTE